MSTLIHISSDYPNPLTPVTTRAIAYMVDPLSEYRAMIYAPVRINGLPKGYKGLAPLPFGENKLAIGYSAPPKGLFLAKGLEPVTRYILSDIQKRGLKVSAVQAHKYTIEGLIALQVSEALNVPLLITVQGNTDTRILNVKRGLRATYQRIADRASALLFFAPWAKETFEKTLKIDPHKCHVLPVIIPLDTLMPSPVISQPRLVTMFRLDDYNNKGLITLFNALCRLRKTLPNVHLDVYGGGSAKTVYTLRQLIVRMNLQDHVTLCGPVPHDEVGPTLNQYAAFVMPSKRESYGLVYMESLFSGVPILYSKERGIDGYLPAQDIGYACDPHDERDVLKGIEHLLEQQSMVKIRIARIQEHGDFMPFRRDAILSAYRRILALSITHESL
jgi:glycosyltransferase involved in cell wall biosynthesis